LGIGAHPTFLSRYFDGLIDEVSLYSRALSQQEIQSIFLAGANGKLASCGLNVITSSLDLNFAGLGSPASGNFDIENTGTVTLQTLADVGDSSTGGLGDGGGIHILPIDIDIDGTLMNSAGTPTFITNLGPINPVTLPLTAQTDNLQNLPATGIQNGVLTFTGGTCS